ncbi:UMP-CMP kinase 2, mitochondrial-like [Diabrotica undecimpunctata]|uniref:UMP-CMP kinase 2, mitochondrial-like n=1 Tax=Diabrotica undecimpunctata TaxID=50387 RepID=UPI003B63CA41
MLKCTVLVAFLVLLEHTCSGRYLQTCGPNDNEKIIFNQTDYNVIGPPLLYHDVESVLELLRKPEYKTNIYVQQLLEQYHQAKEREQQIEVLGNSKKYPLIVIEGMSGTGKTTVVTALINKLNAKQIHSPPEQVKALRWAFRNSTDLDMAYQAIGNYIGGLEVQSMLKDSPVVMDRYWHSYAALAISTAVNNYPEKYQFPPKGDKVFNWPEDLLKPDIVLLLSVDEDIRQQRLNKRRKATGGIEKPDSFTKFLKKCPLFLSHMLTAYKRMHNPGVVVIDGNPTVEEVLNSIYLTVKPLIKKSQA